ncbi:hypothetical protein [Butyrivibrio sp. YAB3001]|uniref:hypothetical protein n=1 Tax=Butyrivibrio sp. YAB3001 TaxID=1520812 RepID=UPI0008F64903|nr:hypothetical protein [Butyrivibrio sp. YAB3001]SFB87972.1 hypothetical protein SAMN02910398_00982 [Butyrivibrio sp. YAB3001]
MKPYLTIHHIIQEIIGVVTGVAALIVSIVMLFTIKEPVPVHYDLAGNVDKYGSIGTVIVLQVFLLPTIFILLAAIHLFPLSLWSLPVKPKPGREVLIYRDTAYLVTLYTLQTGVYSLLSTVFMGLGKTTLVGPLSIVLCVTMILTAVVMIVKSILDNR